MRNTRATVLTIMVMCITFALSAATACAASGELIWKYKADNWIRTTPALAEDGTILFGSNDGVVYALNPDGTEKWRFETTGAIWRGPSIGDDGTAYVACGGGTLFAVTADGTERWRIDIGAGDYVSSTPAIGADGTVYVGSEDGNLYAVSPQGDVVWRYAAGTPIRSSPSIGPDGTIYVGSEDGAFLGVNPDGTERFRHAIRWEMDVRSSAAIASDGTVVVGASDGFLYALSPNGDLRWEILVAAGVLFSSPAIGPDGTIYIGSYDERLHAVSAEGASLWDTELDGLVSSSPTVGADGTIYIGTEAGTLYAVAPDGDVLWTFFIGEEIYYSSAALAEDGTLYIGAFDDHVYAVETSSMGLADSPWPTFGGNTRRTSQSGTTAAPSAQVAPPSASSGVTLSMWPLPYPTGYPAGVTIDAAGRVYFVDATGTEVLRLDPAANLYRSWGVGSRPKDVILANDTVLCTVAQDNLLVYFNPDSQAVSSVSLPSPSVGLTKVHRGPNASSGKLVFWVAEREAQGVLRYEFDPASAPGIVGSQSDDTLLPQTTAVNPTFVTASYEKFPYDVTLMPAPGPITPFLTSGGITEWRLDIEDYLVEDIAVAADGTVWISAGVPFLFRLDATAGTLQMMETIRNVAIFQGLLPDPDGSIWFSNIVEGAIGHFDPVLGLSETWRIPGTGEVYDLIFDAQGRIWYTDRVGDAIGRLDVGSGEVIVFALPSDSEPLHLAIDSNGDVWFTAGSGGYVGRLATGAE